MSFIRIGERYRLAVRHPTNVPVGKVSVYYRVRRRMGVRQTTIADWLGISVQSFRHRERRKSVYHLGELLALKELAELNNDEFVALLESCA